MVSSSSKERSGVAVVCCSFARVLITCLSLSGASFAAGTGGSGFICLLDEGAALFVFLRWVSTGFGFFSFSLALYEKYQ